MSGVPFGLMAGLLFKFSSRLSMAKHTAQSSTTFLTKVAFQMFSGFCSETMFLLTYVKQSLISSETVKFQRWSGLRSPLRRVQFENPETLPQLGRLLFDQWRQILQNFISSLVASMRNRIGVVLQSRDGSTQ